MTNSLFLETVLYDQQLEIATRDLIERIVRDFVI